MSDTAIKDQMDIYINLNDQATTRFKRKTLIIFLIITFTLAAVSGITSFLGHKDSSGVLGVFYMIYFLLIAIALYMQLKGKHILDLLGKSYLKMNTKGIECKNRIFDRNVTIINWSDIEDIEIKLFEARIKTQNGWTSIDLGRLSDDNLKLVKEKLQDFKNNLTEKESLLV